MKLICGAIKPKTFDKYTSHWIEFQLFVMNVLNIYLELPVPIGILTQFVSYLFLNRKSVSSIRNYLSAIAFAHRARSLPDCIKSGTLNLLLTGIRKAMPPCTMRHPINLDKVKMLILKIKSGEFSEFDKVLFKCILLVCYHGCFRIGELLDSDGTAEHTLKICNVFRIYLDGHLDAIKFKLHSHKFSGPFIPEIELERRLDPNICPVRAVMEYRNLRSHKGHYLFAHENGKVVTRRYFAKLLVFALKACGLDHSKYSTHSIRVGAATDMANRGLSVTQIKMRGRWHTYAFIRYLRQEVIRM